MSGGRKKESRLKDPDYSPEEVKTSSHKRWKKLELPRVKMKEPIESKEKKEEEIKTSRGVKRKLKVQPPQSAAAVRKKSVAKIEVPPSSKTVRNIKHSDDGSLQAEKPEEISEPNRKSIRIQNTLKSRSKGSSEVPVIPNVIAGSGVKNDDISSELKKEAAESSNFPFPKNASSPKRSNTASSTLSLDSDPEVSIVKTSSQVLAMQPPLSSQVSLPEVPEVFGPPLATSSQKDLTEEFSDARQNLPQLPPQMKKEAPTAQEFTEDSNGNSKPSPESVAERYYHQIGSQPTPTIPPQPIVKAEGSESAEESERSVFPPVSAHPQVAVVDDGVSSPAGQRGVRGRPGYIRGQPVRGARGRGQPFRGALAAPGRVQPLRGGPGLVMRGRRQVNLNMRARDSPRLRGDMARPRGQIMTQNPALIGWGGRGPVRALVRSPAPVRARAPDPAALPRCLLNLHGLSVTKQRAVPVSLPEGLRLPAGVTLSHPRGIQNQSPPSRSHDNPSPAPPPAPDTEKKQKVSLELTAEQIEILRSLGYL